MAETKDVAAGTDLVVSSGAQLAAGNQQPDAEVATLTRSQERAMFELMNGLGAMAAAVAGGVHRATVHRWLRDDPAFIAVYRMRQADLRENARGRLVALADRAMDAVHDSVEKGDTRTALAVLKGLGLLTPSAPGPIDKDTVAG